MKYLLQLLLLVILSVAVSFGLSKTKVVENLENWTYDIRQLAFAPETKASDEIVMIWLDETTMKDLPYRSPIPRDFLAKLNDNILKAEPKLVAYDIFLKDPSFPEADHALSESLKNGDTYAVVPMRTDNSVDQANPIFQSTLKGTGLADLPFNALDSVVRSTRLEFPTDLGKTPSIASLIYEKTAGKKAIEVISDRRLWPHIGPIYLTPFIKKNGELPIRFAGPPSVMGSESNRFKVFPAHLAARGFLPENWLKDKIVLVGASYKDLKDDFLTPYFASVTNYAKMNGVEIHANILSSLLTKQFYYTLDDRRVWSLQLFFILIVLFLSTKFSVLRSAGSLIIILAAIVASGFLSFKKFGYIIPVVLPISGSLVSYGFGIGWRALTEGRQKRWIKGVFSQYVPPAVVNQMIENPKLVRLGGEERIVTSLFSDIASFTSISEKMSPSELVKFLNEYLTKMNEIIFRHGGTIDKYEGDAIIAFFNAPVDLAKHEVAAVTAAIEMQDACLEITKKWQESLGFPIVTRVGINTGPAVVGNMGSEDRFDYTAIGDTINLASRLEGTNKFYGTKVMASEMTVKGLDESAITRPIDRVRVKGKSEAILLYEVMGKRGSGTDYEKLAAKFLEGFKAFENRDLKRCEDITKEILHENPEDGPTRELTLRLNKAREDSRWDLVTNLTSK